MSSRIRRRREPESNQATKSFELMASICGRAVERCSRRFKQMPEKTFPITVVRGQNLPQTGTPAPERSTGIVTTVWNAVLHLFGRRIRLRLMPRRQPLGGCREWRRCGDFATAPRNRTPGLARYAGRAQNDRNRHPVPQRSRQAGRVDAFKKSIQSNKENAVLIFQVIGRLLRREASLKQLDGPVGIVAVSGQAYQAGFATLLTFMALISLNLGVLEHSADSHSGWRRDSTAGHRIAHGP